MTNLETINEQLNEFTKTVRKAGGSVLVIGIATDETDPSKKGIIASLNGNKADLIAAVSKLYEHSADIRDILLSGATAATILRLTKKASADSVKEQKTNV